MNVAQQDADVRVTELQSILKTTAIAAIGFWTACLVSYLWLDDPAERMVRDIGRDTFTSVMGRVGSWEVLVPILSVIALCLLILRRELFAAMFLVLSYVMSAVATGLLKTGLARPEPGDVAGDLGRSFPSGHATQATAVYLAIVVIAYVCNWASKRVLLYCAVGLCIIASTALFVRNSHWLSDFFGGFAIGLTAICIAGSLWMVALRATSKSQLAS